ncbi:hypothetical protein KKC59_03750 [bacterium]|nr:hypothetical protein [bacterium]
MSAHLLEPEIKLIDLIRKIRCETPAIDDSLDLLKGTEIRQGYLNGAAVKRAVITLKSTGCEWVRISGGCSLCGHYVCTTQGREISDREYVEDFLRQYNSFDFSDIPLLCLYNSGSVLNSAEISRQALFEICKIIALNKNIKKLVLETRIEYCDKDYILKLKDLLGNIDLELALGLECKDEFVRNVVLNKGISNKNYEDFSAEFKGLVDFRFYIIVKPPFLTEKEALDDAVLAVEYALELGAKEVHLEPATIQKYTLGYFLNNKGLYNLPWLYTIIEILRQFKGKNIYVSPFAHKPSPVKEPVNCSWCSADYKNLLLKQYNYNQDVSVFDNINCSCIKDWEKDMAKVDLRSMDQRIKESLV